jgi:hypothetical protein
MSYHLPAIVPDEDLSEPFVRARHRGIHWQVVAASGPMPPTTPLSINLDWTHNFISNWISQFPHVSSESRVVLVLSGCYFPVVERHFYD